jgi:predicted nucleic acid-binding protein
MIAVDTPIIVYHFLPGEKTKHTENLLKRDSNWITSPLWKYEFRNVLAGFIRKDLVSFIDAIAISEEAEQFFLHREVQIPPAKIVDLINRSPCTGYDLEFVAVAIEMGTKLVTNDKEILKHFPEISISINCYEETSST